MRADKQMVLDMLFSAFERHQFYNIKDLVDLTKQPVVRPSAAPAPPEGQAEQPFSRLHFLSFQLYLKKVLREIGMYNVKGSHKHTWELRPEYRHYGGEKDG